MLDMLECQFYAGLSTWLFHVYVYVWNIKEMASLPVVCQTIKLWWFNHAVEFLFTHRHILSPFLKHWKEGDLSWIRRGPLGWAESLLFVQVNWVHQVSCCQTLCLYHVSLSVCQLKQDPKWPGCVPTEVSWQGLAFCDSCTNHRSQCEPINVTLTTGYDHCSTVHYWVKCTGSTFSSSVCHRSQCLVGKGNLKTQSGDSTILQERAKTK